jgi:hypothetical protein
MGFNPFYHNEEVISETLRSKAEILDNAVSVEEIFFYGAGCSSPERNETVQKALETVFKNAKVYVGHDVLGAAIAACQREEGIACILGTGSNSCYYDGSNVSEVVPALGFILGDEGSGAWFGKKMLTDYLYKEPLPVGLVKELEQLGHTKNSILENVYMKPHVNVYLASFMKIIANHRDTDYVQDLVSLGMREFLLRHVCCFENFQKVQASFVGSVAFHFQEILKTEAGKLNITVGNVIQKPIDGLMKYHLKA